MAGRQSTKQRMPGGGGGQKQKAESSHLQTAIAKQWTTCKWCQAFRNFEILPVVIYFFQKGAPPNCPPHTQWHHQLWNKWSNAPVKDRYAHSNHHDLQEPNGFHMRNFKVHNSNTLNSHIIPWSRKIYWYIREY